MADNPRMTVRVVLAVEVEMEVTDSGYLGSGVSVLEHVEAAKKKARGWQWFVKQGGTEPKPVRAKTTVTRVEIEGWE